MKKTLAERVKHILDELDISQVKLAEMTGCTRGAVNQWLKLSTAESTMAPEHAFRLADQTNYEPRWLMIGEGPETKENIDRRERALLDLYRASDERGRSTILRAAEQEFTYVIDDEEEERKSA